MMFHPHHIELIAKGIKTATRRRHRRPMERVCGTYYAKERMYQPRSEARVWYHVTRVYTQRLGDITEEDARKEGGYTLEGFRRVWEEINEVPWNPDEGVYVYEFKRAEPPLGSEVHAMEGDDRDILRRAGYWV